MSSFPCLSRQSYLYYRVSMDNTTLSEVTTMITDFNQDFTNFYPTLAVIITLILDDDDYKVTESIVMYVLMIIGIITTPT